MTTPVDMAIEAAGGLTALSKALGLSHPTVIGWRRRGAVPADRVAQVALVTGLSPAALRPDLAALFAEDASPDCVSDTANKRDAA